MQEQSRFALAAQERLVFIRPASLPGTEVMAAYQSSRRWHVFHERYAFCACHSAAASVRYRGVEERVDDGDVVVREPGETVCSIFVAKPAEFKMLFVAPSLVDDAARELGHSGSLHFAPRTIREDPHLFAELHRLCSSIEAAHDALEQQSLFATTMVALARHTERKTELPEAGNGKRAVERAKAYLRERFNEPISLAELATACGLSRFYLVHAFTKETGLSPHAYQVHVRIERARSLLLKGISFAAAAASLGFADQSHFTRHFKRIMHVTPKQYASTKSVDIIECSVPSGRHGALSSRGQPH
jgi:AraC-like DNA-binding protein